MRSSCLFSPSLDSVSGLSLHKNRSCLRRSRNRVRVWEATSKLESITSADRLKKLGGGCGGSFLQKK